MVLAALKEKSKGDEILEEYKATDTLSNEMRRALVNILVHDREAWVSYIFTFKITDCHLLFFYVFVFT